jgi:hypothetical protein
MPSSTSGLTGTEILEFLRQYVGNQSSSFTSFMTTALFLAELRFCKLHDWAFLNKQNLSLTVSSGTNTYDLSVANIGFYMQCSNVRTIWSAAGNQPLQKTTLERIRQMDADDNDGSTNRYPEFWAPVNDNQILIWPTVFKGTALKIDGKITPTALLTLSNYPTIPIHMQETFIEYLKAVALDRENDDRAAAKKQEVMGMVRQDIADDMAALGDAEEPRMKSAIELAQKQAESKMLHRRIFSTRKRWGWTQRPTSPPFRRGTSATLGTATLGCPAAT